MKVRLVLFLLLFFSLGLGAEELLLEKKAELKEAPGKDSRLIKVLESGTSLQLLGNFSLPGEYMGDSGKWIPVQYENTTGWIFRADERTLQEILLAGEFTGLWKDVGDNPEYPVSFLELNKNGLFEWLEGETGFSGEWYCDVSSAILTFRTKGLDLENLYYKLESCNTKEIILQQVDIDGNILDEPRSFIR